jgi:uncharacterized protein YyaL (SSP411 family)
MNRLAEETSPYLLQHATNPVDWYPWGAEALDRARREDKPILLSIGYAACHWCHVMAHESFEDPAIAALMNTHFVNIKVDREERPDLDSIYMQAVQAMTGHGGWPMTVFLLPSGEPYYGGTYFPPSDRHGIPGFPRLLVALATAYREDRARVAETGARVRAIYEAAARPPGERDHVTASHLDRAFRGLAQQFDRTFAGFGGAPKFPPSMSLDFLLRYWARTGRAEARDMAQQTFLAMARGGICDQVGGGLHRYSVDERWLVPHFEKMLYDNALFIRVGVELWRVSRDEEVRQATTRAIAWLAKEMTSPEGGFYSSLDADSEGHEGVFYVWSDSELDAALGADALLVKRAWGITRAGNFEGRSIPHLSHPPATVAQQLGISPAELDALLDRARTKLYALRATRPWPATDDKVLAAWNGLAVRALCAAATAFGDATPARALALQNGAFLRTHLVDGGRVRRSWRAGRVLEVGFLEDAAAVGLAFLDLFALTGAEVWLADAREVTARLVADFHDEAHGLFFDTPRGHEELLTRPRDIADNAMPAGSSLAAELLARMAVLDDDSRLESLARALVDGLAESIARHPLAFGHLAGVADLLVHGAIEVAVPGGSAPLEQVLGETFVPSLVFTRDVDLTALSRGKAPATGYVCRRYSCDAPTTDPTVFSAQLVAARGGAGG